jgi:anti-sigma B factor antagonist
VCGFPSSIVEEYVNLSRRSIGSLTVLNLDGRLVAGSDDVDLRRLRAVTRDIVAAGRRQVVVNLSGLTQIDACGLGALAAMMSAVQTGGGRVTLVGATARVAPMLALTKLDSVFDWETTAEEIPA